MIDFAPLRNQQMNLRQLAQGIGVGELGQATDVMIDTMLDLIEMCVDEDVTFVPADADAYDRYATSEEEVEMPWTLGHVLVHVTASAEESAALAAELARGVEFHGRSRYEVPWQSIRTVDQCRRRLEESRRIRLASLQMWPDPPHLDNSYTPYKAAGRIGPVERFLLGLLHDSDHLGQIEEIARQAGAARSRETV